MRPWLKRIYDSAAATYEECPVACAVFAAAVTLGGVYLLHQATGGLVGLLFLYIIPIWIAARIGNFWSGVGSVAATLIVLSVTDMRGNPNIGQSELIGSALLRGGTLTLVMFLIWSVEDRKRQAQSAALRDSLTDLLNRQAMTQYARFAIERTIRNREPLCVVMIDVDQFKAANDQFGHSIGDRILKMLAEKLDKGVQPVGTVARWGGDEFMVVLQDVNADEAEAIMLRINDRFAGMTEAFISRMSFTFGVSQFGPGGFNFPQLVQAADADMYRRKRKGVRPSIRDIVNPRRLAS